MVTVQYKGAAPLTLMHFTWYPGETWKIDAGTLANLRAEHGNELFAVQGENTPFAVGETTEPAPEPIAKQGRK